MGELPVRKTERLRLGRVSLPGARYFVTACVQDRASVLMNAEQLQRCRAAMNELAECGDWQLLASTVMPDHWHVLFVLGERLTLGRITAKLKSRSRPVNAVWRWQPNVFEHRLRADEAAEDYAFYIFMNPYRAGVIGIDGAWPGWLSGALWRWRFEVGLTSNGSPPVEWIDRVKDVAERICSGE